MVTRRLTATASHKLAGGAVDHVESVVSAGEVVEVESVGLIVVAIAVVSAEASEGTGVARGAARGAVSESSPHGV